ncbi:MAG TPA: hypothetical protein VFT98_13150 [Myxococcota bacterium]|nr:hypothetical protein [Myxococcota bacterium]
MRRTLRGALVLAAALLVASPLAAQTKRWFEDSDKVYIRQNFEFIRIQEPDVHMKRARRSFEKGQRSNASNELERAAAGFAYFAERAAGAQRRELTTASRALNELADQIRKREVDEITTLDRAIADAERVLAGGPPPRPAQPQPAKSD